MYKISLQCVDYIGVYILISLLPFNQHLLKMINYSFTTLFTLITD